MSAQHSKKLDSLIQVSNNYKQLDSVKMRMLIRVYGELIYTSADRAVAKKYVDSAKAIALKLPNRDCINKFYIWVGVWHHGKGEFIEALNLYNMGLQIVAKAGDKGWQAGYYMSMSDIYNNLTDYASAIDVCEKAIQLYSEINNQSGIASIYNNLSGTYIALKDYVTAYNYATKALPIFEQEGINSRGVASIKQIMASILLNADESSLTKIKYTGSSRFNKVIQLMNESLPIAVLEKDKGMQADLLIAKATAYEQLNQIAKATEAFNNAVTTAEEGPNLNALTTTYSSAGNFFIRQLNSKLGLVYLHNALAKSTESGLLEVEVDVCESLSSYYEKIKRYDSSLYYFKRFSRVTNDIFNKEKEKEITRKKLLLDFSIKEKEYAVEQEKINQQLAEKKLEISFKNKLAWLMGILTIIVVTAAWFIYQSRKKTLELNKTIEAQRQSLTELVQVKDKIFSVITHDMRSPVNSLISFVYLLEQEEVSKDKLAIYAKELGNTLRGTSALMENLLSWAGSQLQGFDINIESVSVDSILPEILDSFSATIKQKNIQIHQTISVNTNALADKQMLSLVIRNLVSNALKFSYPGDIILFSANIVNGEVAISIADTGTGMSSATITNINHASPHSLTSTYGTAKEKGTGLGLVLCKNFLGMMSGKLIAKPNDPKGTVMVIYIPSA